MSFNIMLSYLYLNCSTGVSGDRAFVLKALAENSFGPEVVTECGVCSMLNFQLHNRIVWDAQQASFQ